MKDKKLSDLTVRDVLQILCWISLALLLLLGGLTLFFVCC